jgi:heptosyltransferase-2
MGTESAPSGPPASATTAAADGPLGPATPDVAVLMPTWLGDIVMATPALARLRAALPHARITALVPPGMDVVLAELSSLDAVAVVRSKGPAGAWRTAAAIRRASRHAVILLPNSFRSALAARLAGPPVRLGTPRDGRSFLLSHVVHVPCASGPVPAVRLYDRIVATAIGREPIELDGSESARLRPQLVASAHDHAAMRAALGDRADDPRLVLVPGGNRDDKRWPAERFAAVARSLRESHGLLPVVSGSPGERPLCADLARAIGDPMVDLAATGGSLAAVKGAIAGARLLITNDTGPRHLAAGLGTPCVALFGPTDPRWTTLPAVPESVLAAEPFLPEQLVADRHADLCRIDRIPVSDVRFAAERRLAAAPPSPAEGVPT